MGRSPRGVRWSIVTSAPKGEAGEQWGDTWFARDLAAALERAGQQVRVVSRSGAVSEKRGDDDVVVVLRGLREVTPPADHPNVWMLWVISHPELVSVEEVSRYDALFAASATWQPPGEVRAETLLQATASERFHLEAAPADSGAPVLFVGSTRGQFRPAVRGALASSRADELAIYGVGWEEFVPAERINGEFLANAELPAVYGGAGIVLNDHHPEMAADGFLSNRLFDAVATGTRVLSDRAAGIDDVFGDAVVVYDDEEHLAELLSRPVDEVFPSSQEREAAASRIAREHSFDVRAAVLIDRARDLVGGKR